MELSQLKKEIHAYVDEVDDERALLAVAEVLEKYGLSSIEKNDYEQSDEFWNGINRARTSITLGKGIPDHEARQIIQRKMVAKK